MFAAVRRYHVKPGRIAEVTRLVQEGLLPVLSRQRGFAAYHAIDAGDNVLLAVGLYQDRRSAEAANDAASAWVKDHLAELLGPADAMVGKVIASASAVQA